MSRSLHLSMIVTASVAGAVMACCSSAAAVAHQTTGVVWQGESISLSDMNAQSGPSLVVGAPYSNDAAGAALFFKRNNKGEWKQVAKFTELSQRDSKFGHSVSVSLDGTVALVGAPNYGASIDNPYEGPGAAYVYRYKNGSWKKSAVLRGTNVLGNARLGYSVWISPDGKTGFVGGKEDNNGLGAVWVYDLTGSSPKQQGKLLPSDANGAARFGQSISSSKTGDRVVIGGSEDAGSMGASWIFERKNGKWAQIGSKIVGVGGVGGYQAQGYSLSMKWAGDGFVTGAPWDNDYRGSAFVFERSSNGNWVQKIRLTDPVTREYGNFGESVAMSGGNGSNIIVGEPYAAITADHDGEVLNFARNSPTASYLLKATITTGPCERLGESVAISPSSDFILASGPSTLINGQGTGATCFYVKDNSLKEPWKLTGKPIYGK